MHFSLNVLRQKYFRCDEWCEGRFAVSRGRWRQICTDMLIADAQLQLRPDSRPLTTLIDERESLNDNEIRDVISLPDRRRRRSHQRSGGLGDARVTHRPAPDSGRIPDGWSPTAKSRDELTYLRRSVKHDLWFTGPPHLAGPGEHSQSCDVIRRVVS